MIRATTGGVLKSYRSNLMNSFISQNKARDTVLTQRTFNSYAEDPASAAKAFRLRNSRMTVHSQYNICNDTYHKYQAAWSCLESVSLMVDNETSEFMSTLSGTTKEWLNDPTGDAREQLTKVLDQVSEGIIQNMNQTYGDNFIFAGADGHNVPFEVRGMEDGTKKLYYRGVPVDAAVPKVLTDATGDPIMVGTDVNNKSVIDANGTGYLSANAKLVEVPVPAQLPQPLQAKNGAGDPENLMLDAGGNVVFESSGEGVSYILTAKVYDGNERQQAIDDGTATEDCFTEYVDDGVNKYIHKFDAGTTTISKEEYDDIKNTLDNAMLGTDGNRYVLTKDGKDYYILNKDDESTITKEQYDEAVLDTEKLKYLMNEKLFVDIGLGFQENEEGNLIQSSAFNAALIGVDFLGYGVDEDGDPKNIFSLVQKMTELCDSVPEGGSWDKVWPDFERLVGKLEAAASDFKTEYTNFDAGTTKLKSNVALLEDNFYNLQEQYGELEDVDMADAITSFIWAQYCYNAALKVGNSVLSESLMDYLN